ncbi:MAG: ABC transporter ATP-binding protein [Clostridium sp.]|nr:ABC transporter ATP-binding protein [Clostridium sp.]
MNHGFKKPIIEFENFSFKYKSQQGKTLKNINLTIYEGEKVLIVGPSGSGKSTISNAINGLIPFMYEGEIEGSLKVNGKETKDMSIFELSSEVGTVLQDPDSQFIGLTVAEDLAFRLENDCVLQDKMRTIVSEVSKVVDIDDHLSASPHSLSGGQKQRVTLGGVMVSDVNILLFDEPLASLDPATGKNAMELIDDIQKKNNKTIIIIEHRLEDVLHSNIDRIVLIDNGQIRGDLKVAELLSSNILNETGIREPLYITALKYAGIDITKDLKPESIESLNVDSIKDNLKSWCEKSLDEEEIESVDTILELDDVRFGYDKEKEILKGISFKINKGEMVSIVGRNGAGKSTISKLISGFYKPTSGKIFFNGKSLENDSIKERSEKIGVVMQNPNSMISKAMIYDEVALGLRIKGINEDEIKEKVYDVLKICGLYEFRNWPISALSFGQKKRVTIASILVLNPEIIILDEPTAGQDYKHYNEIMEFLRKLNRDGITIIMITHDMHLMLEYTNKTIVLSDGKKIAEDSAANILTDEKVIKAANLKETSLYKLALKAELKEPRKFVKRFIKEDRRIRNI